MADVTWLDEYRTTAELPVPRHPLDALGMAAVYDADFSTSYPAADASLYGTAAGDLGTARPVSAGVPVTDLIGFPGFDEETQGWHEDALCAETDPEAFFPEKGGSTREAKKICTGCPVRAQCLEFALDNDERFGIWGGLSERERRRVKRAS